MKSSTPSASSRNDVQRESMPRKLDHQVSVRLNREDWALLTDYGARRGLRLTQLLRSCALDRALADSEPGVAV